MQSKSVELALPRFSIRSKLGLVPALSALGMHSAFSYTSADFSGIVGSNPAKSVFISNVIHEAFVDVNENGSEAAAATAVIFGDSGVSMEPVEPETMVVNRPFIFLIRDRGTGAVLFAGQMFDPTTQQ